MESTTKLSARDFAAFRLEEALAYLREQECRTQETQLAEDCIEDVLDQLRHWCGNRNYYLYAPGETQPMGSRLREAWRMLTARRK